MVGTLGSNGAGVQIHCNCYRGPAVCPQNKPPPPPCFDILTTSSCARWKERGQCGSSTAVSGCAASCGHCGSCSGNTAPSTPEQSACFWPRTTGSCSLITEGDAVLGSHSHYSGLCIGGRLTDSSPSQHGTVGAKSWVTDIGTAASRFHWAD